MYDCCIIGIIQEKMIDNNKITEIEEKVNVWDKSVPVEKSSYLNSAEAVFLNEENVKNPEGELKMLDLFCGAGGFSVGCKWSGFESVFGIDHLKPAMDTWMYNHPNALGCLGDIRGVTPKQVHEKLEAKGITHIHLITGGVPCQGFSIANRKHNDEDERNFLFLEYMKYVEEFKPDYIILENVSGMRSTAGGKFENEIKMYMESLGYNPTVKLVNAAEYGVPQTRMRLLFIGVKKNSGLAEKYIFPKGNFEENPQEGSGKRKFRTVSDAISDLPKLENKEGKISYESDANTEYQKMMRGESNYIDQSKSSRLLNHVAPNHPQNTIDKIANTKPGEPMYEKFKQRIRLRMDAPSPTQLAGGIRPQFQFGHPEQPRGLSIRERARIQSFPDTYKFMGGMVQERVQTGNAVPPLLIHEITKSIAEDIRKKYSEGCL